VFKKTPAKLSLLLLTVLLLPVNRMYADSNDIVIGTDPQPSGDPKIDAGNALLLGMQVAMTVL
jgi:hypothetical protein